jgi:transcriptional regulator with XRE-family HTH domain
MKHGEIIQVQPANEDIQAISRALRNRRRLLKITQDDLSDLAGISKRYLYTIEKGIANPSVDTLLKLMDVLGLTLEIKIKTTNISE